jgi:short subunit dehydrogenase-like uncharacterized protein
VSERDLDVVVFGATGVTGRRVAAYLAERADAAGARWAIAVRDPNKAVRLLEEAGVSAGETIRADVSEQGTLEAMAARARVVLNLVGPYTLYGRPVIAACVAGGAHYVDLTGEMTFVRRMIDEFDQPARSAGVKVIQTCGFEALPPDLAVALAAEAARERWEDRLATVDLEVKVKPPPGPPRLSDAISGGTLQSMFAVAGAPDAEQITDPALLIADVATAAAVRRTSPIGLAPRSGPEGEVIAPMAPAAFINPALIHRSAALLAAFDGQPAAPFRYREGVALGGGNYTLALRWAVAGAMSAGQAGLRALARANPDVRSRVSGTLARAAPGSGFGPAEERLEGWGWGMSVQATTVGGKQVAVEVRAEGHPGYLSTARMLGEAGLLLAEPDATPARAGHLTPATALGTASVERLRNARLSFSVPDPSPESPHEGSERAAAG